MVVVSPAVVAHTLEAREPEELVLKDRAARRRAKLLEICRSDPCPVKKLAASVALASRPNA